MTPTELFEEIVALTGVSPVLAPGMVKRSLADGGVSVEAARPEDYEAALGRIRARLKAYVSPGEAEARTIAIGERLSEVRGLVATKTPGFGLRRGGTPALGTTRSEIGGERVPSGEHRLPSGEHRLPSGEHRLPSGEIDLEKITSRRLPTAATVRGTSAKPAKPAAARTSAAPAVEPEPFDDGEVTLLGRRWTADELAQLEAAKKEAAKKGSE